jgi:hypothetical protein
LLDNLELDKLSTETLWKVTQDYILERRLRNALKRKVSVDSLRNYKNLFFYPGQESYICITNQTSAI